VTEDRSLGDGAPAAGRGPAPSRPGAATAPPGREGAAEIVARDLRSLLRGDVEFDDITRYLYATDAGLNQVLPLGVVSPRDTDDVVRLVGYCAERGLPLVARGMGSGLAGGAVGAGIQVDFTRYMNRILEVAPDGSWARVQPGVVMASLNEHAHAWGTFFAPDPSSENYCSLGGMIGTNSSGARTVAYGGTIDHVLALEVVLPDASVYPARPLPADGPELAALLAGDTLAGRAFASILPRLQAQSDAIAAAMPRVVKNCSGYRLETILEKSPAAGGAGRAGTVHLQRLFVGAEGTLGLVTEATLNLVPLPAQRGIAMAYFPSVFASGEAVPGILALRPTAVEIMDSRFLALVRRHDSRVDAMLPPATDTALLIEFEGEDEDAVAAKLAELEGHLSGTACLQVARARTAEETARLWTVRKSAVALALRMPGPRRALPFIEDVTVHPTEVPGYVDFLQKLFDRTGVEAVMYGHVGDGNIHTRPLLDPKDPGDLRTMQALYDEVSEYVRDIRGTMSGEHGDGLLRTPYLRQMYGDEIYTLFSLAKEAFDPQGLMNPGKKVAPQETSGSLLRDLRYGAGYRTLRQSPLLHFPGAEYEREIEKCHGCGQCKSVVATTMCPTYKATRKEHASPRAKANLLRAVIAGGLDPGSTYGRAATKTVTDYCIVCGMCAVECPSHVNIPKLMLEAKAKYRAAHPGAPVERVLGHPETVSRLGHALAPVANPLLRNRAARRLAEALLGIDRRRTMAPFARRTFADMFPAGRTPVCAGGCFAAYVARPGAPGLATDSPVPAPADPVRAVPEPTVAYFYDLFANYNDPELALAVLRVLEAHGIRMLLPPQRAAGIPEMLYGYARRAADIARFNLEAVLPAIQSGAVLVSAEPTATFAFKVHYPDYAPGRACSLVADATRDLGEFLLRRRLDHPETAPAARPLRGRGGLSPFETAGAAPGTGAAPPRPLRVAYHLPCHLKAQEVGSPGLELLREIPGVEVIDLAAGCCGMAGTFGMRKGTFDFSLQVGEPLFRRIAEVAPDLVASECSTCRLQVTQAVDLETVHPVTLLAEAYGV
jgi:FAD/FMN-containing dehydrogenase/Fe-S oxidoreductase